MKRIIVVSVLSALFAQASAQVACDRLTQRIEDSIKVISFESVHGLFDNSAPRETNRQLRVISAWNSIQISLLQQQTLKCKPYSEPITGNEYSSSARACSLAFDNPDKEEGKRLCDRSTWKKS